MGELELDCPILLRIVKVDLQGSESNRAARFQELPVFESQKLLLSIRTLLSVGWTGFTCVQKLGWLSSMPKCVSQAHFRMKEEIALRFVVDDQSLHIHILSYRADV